MNYTQCPKCAQALPSGEQTAETDCPACGLILAKYGSPPVRRTQRAQEENRESEEKGFVARWLFHIPNEVAKINWITRCVTLAFFSSGPS